jgi:hypothetical protein
MPTAISIVTARNTRRSSLKPIRYAYQGGSVLARTAVAESLEPRLFLRVGSGHVTSDSGFNDFIEPSDPVGMFTYLTTLSLSGATHTVELSRETQTYTLWARTCGISVNGAFLYLVSSGGVSFSPETHLMRLAI